MLTMSAKKTLHVLLCFSFVIDIALHGEHVA